MILAIRIYPPIGIHIGAPRFDSFNLHYEDLWVNQFRGYVKENIYYIYQTGISSFKSIYPVDILLEYWK